MAPRIHPTADVSAQAQVGAGSAIWHQAQIMPEASIGEDCIIGKGVYVDTGVIVGPRSKVQNYALLYRGATIGADVFIGPAAVLTNDRYPRASTPDGTRKHDADWTQEGVTIEDGASIGANATLGPGISVGRHAMVGSGAVVTQDVPAHALVVGQPARGIGFVCTCGHRLAGDPPRCVSCRREFSHTPDGLREADPAT